MTAPANRPATATAAKSAAPAAKPATAPAAASKSADSKPAESAASKASRTAPLNLASLSFADTAAPVRKASRTRDVAVYRPLMTQLADSWSKKTTTGSGANQTVKGSGKAVTVPTSASKQLVGMIRTAVELLADERNEPIGVAITTEDHSNGSTTVKFCAKRKRNSHK